MPARPWLLLTATPGGRIGRLRTGDVGSTERTGDVGSTGRTGDVGSTGRTGRRGEARLRRCHRRGHDRDRLGTLPVGVRGLPPRGPLPLESRVVPCA